MFGVIKNEQGGQKGDEGVCFHCCRLPVRVHPPLVQKYHFLFFIMWSWKSVKRGFDCKSGPFAQFEICCFLELFHQILSSNTGDCQAEFVGERCINDAEDNRNGALMKGGQ